MSGRGAGSDLELFVAGLYRIRRFHQGSWTTVYTSPINATFRALHVTADGAVLAAGTGLTYCPGGCTVQNAFIDDSRGMKIEGICARGKQVYAVGNDSTNRGQLHRFKDGQWETLSSYTNTHWNKACFVAADASVYIAAQSVVARYDGVGVTPEPFDFPPDWTSNDVANQFFESVAQAGEAVVASGKPARVFARGANGRWTLAHAPQPKLEIAYALAPSTGTDLVLMGYGEQALERTNGVWSFIASTPRSTLHDSWSAGPNEHYVVGTVRNELDALVLRLKR